MTDHLALERLDEIERVAKAAAKHLYPGDHRRCASIDGSALLTLVSMARRAVDLERAVRETHKNYCTAAWTDRGLHAPECLLYELETP